MITFKINKSNENLYILLLKYFFYKFNFIKYFKNK